LQKGDTTGVFQLESGGMKRYLKELKPTIFDDIVAMGALYRPGPMEWIPTYIKGKHNPDKVKYLDPSFKSILENTYGVAVYQEQILQLARDFAGFSLGEADLLRKAVGKKIPELLAEQREMFVKGSVKNGHKEKFAMEVFEKVVEPFAGYGFNKAHAVCYGMIAYQTAYLKAHYPVEFMNALLCSDANVTDRVVLEIKECNEMGIDVLPPSINESFANFTVVDDKTIRFGLLAIKGIGDGPVSEVIAEREKNGKFKSLDDFARRVPSKNLNKKLIQAAAYSGALDEWGDRKQIAENYEEISKYAKGYQQSVSNGQTDIFGIMENYDEVESFQMRNVPKAGRMENLKWEKEFLGMYVSGHPLQGLRPYIARKGSLIGNLTRKKVGKVVKVIGLVSGLRKMMTKTGGYMAMFSLEDPSGKINAVIFPKTMNSINVDLADDIVLSVSGKFDDKRGQCQILCEQVKAISISTMVQNAKEAGQFDENDKSAFSVRLIDDILADQDAEDESFLIEVPKDASPEKMTQLKDLLIENKGEFPVELDLIAANKRIKLPFGVELTDDLKSKVKSLLES